ncbi:DgyrCDS3371 [Dimorphilus gyrociliatus]|uniref:DgyrCDS3371 n=1 Tax=Dimorphilus gyrociliatus TaxID=2664684 RepID=A0A7I8VEX5_9ANNE|nr:DgyrCDS3371 [Dimorphilus gyrociliatus]
MAEASETDSVDNSYLKEEVGEALVEAVAGVCDARPADPITYIANKLYDFRRNHLLVDTKVEKEREVAETPPTIEEDEKESTAKEEDSEDEEENTSAKRLLRIIQNASSVKDRCNAIMFIRRDLSNEIEPPIQKYVNAGAIPIIIDCLADSDTTIQFEAAWVLTNIAAGSPEQTHAVFEAGAVPVLLELLKKSTKSNVRDQCIWTLGNLMGDKSPNITNFIIREGFIEMLMGVICRASTLSEKRDLSWCIINLVRNKSVDALTQERIRKLLPVIYFLLGDSDFQVMLDTIWSLSYVADLHSTSIQDILDMGLVPILLPYLSPGNQPRIIVPTLRTIGNLITGSDQQTQHVLDAGLIEKFSNLLSDQVPDNLRREALWCVSNMTAGTPQQIQEVLDANLIPKVLHHLLNGPKNVQREALWVLGNMAQGAVQEQLNKVCSENEVIISLVRLFVNGLPVLEPLDFEDDFQLPKDTCSMTIDSGRGTLDSADLTLSNQQNVETFYIKYATKQRKLAKQLRSKFGSDLISVWVESVENFSLKIEDKEKLYQELYDSDGIFCLHILGQCAAYRQTVIKTFMNMKKTRECERLIYSFPTDQTPSESGSEEAIDEDENDDEDVNTHIHN